MIEGREERRARGKGRRTKGEEGKRKGGRGGKEEQEGKGEVTWQTEKVEGTWNNIRYLPRRIRIRILGIYIGANSIINNLLPGLPASRL